jgi:hypothetical protein
MFFILMVKHKIMEITDYVAVGGLIIMTLGFLAALMRHKREVQKQIDGETIQLKIKVNDNSLKIEQLAKEVIELRYQYEKNVAEMKKLTVFEITRVKDELTQKLTNMLQENREDHISMAEDIKDSTKEITRAATLIQAHIEHENGKITKT